MEKRIIYYTNFASHLLNAYNPNMLYPDLPYRWSDADWRKCIDMIQDFGFNVLEFWLVPYLFCRQGLESEVGEEFARQMNGIIEYAASRGIKVEALICLATVGADWRTHCPNVKEEWDEVRYLWDQWMRRLSGLGIVGIFPGDPGACSRNGCTALTYIDKSIEIAEIIKHNTHADIEFHTWGPPFFGWGLVHMPPDSLGEFIQEHQITCWKFDEARAEASMNHLLSRLPDFPSDTAVGINLGFGSDGNPGDEKDARCWAREIAKTNRILTWDYSLTEGENAVYPHYRLERLFERRREEREAAPYSGGICYTMSPLLNQLSLFEAARSFRDPDADPDQTARAFCERLFGKEGAGVVEYLPLFEVVPDWGHYGGIDLTRQEYHRKMLEFVTLLQDLRGAVVESAIFHPSVEKYRQELLFFATLFADLSGPEPSARELRQRYWDRVYAIYDSLPGHVDPRPNLATDNLIGYFQKKSFVGD